MKKIPFLLLLLCVVMTAMTSAKEKQTVIIEKNWPDGTVKFRQVKLSDTLNNQLINRYHAQSQTLIIEKTTKKKVISRDATSVLQEFAKTNDAAIFQSNLIDMINEVAKQ